MEIQEEWPRASPAPLPKTQNGFETFWSSGMPEGVLEFWKGVLKGIPGTIESK
jgi:hypothetical protein